MFKPAPMDSVLILTDECQYIVDTKMCQYIVDSEFPTRIVFLSEMPLKVIMRAFRRDKQFAAPFLFDFRSTM